MLMLKRKLARRVYLNGDAWYILKRIGRGASGKVHKAENGNRVKAIAKFYKLDNDSFGREDKVYRKLQNVNSTGFPRIIGLTEERGRPVLLLERLGPQLGDDFIRDKTPYSISDTCTIGTALVERLRTLHSIGIIHRDLRLDNVVFGKGEEFGMVYLTNFGISQQYRDDNGTHVEDGSDPQNVGNMRYGCKRMFYGLQQSRRDDMESFLYLLAYLMTRHLPWYSNLESFSVRTKKEEYRDSPFYQSLPSQYHEMWENVSHLEFCEEPNYEWFNEKISEMSRAEI